MRQATWPNGETVKVFVLNSSHPAHQRLCKHVLGVFPYQMERLWNKLAFSGLGDVPIEVSSEQEMTLRVRSTPGAIGYVLATSDIGETPTITLAEED